MVARKTPPTAGPVSIYSAGRESTAWWGMLLFVLVEAALSAGMIASYFYFFSNVAVWPPAGIEDPNLLIPTISSVVLIGSIVPAFVADRALGKGNPRDFSLWGGVGVVMVLVALALRLFEYSGLDFRWDDTVYGSIVWLIFGFHTLNVAALLLMALSMLVLAWRGFYNERRRAGAQVTILFWLFVAIVWIPFYATVYLFPNYAYEL